MGEKADCIKITSAFDQAQALKIWLGSVVGVFPCLAHALASTPAPEAASIAAPSPVVLADSVFDVIDKNPVPSQMAIGTLAVPTSVLLGLTLNQTPYPNIAALQHQGDFFLPISPLFDSLGITALQQHDLWHVTTPIGDTQLVDGDFFWWQNQAYISLAMLKKLGITANFSQRDYALTLYMGWNPDKVHKGAAATAAKVPTKATYTPSRFGVLGVAIDSHIRQSTPAKNTDDSSTYSQFDTQAGIFGYGGGGVWGLNAATQQPQAAALNLDTLTNWRRDQSTINNLYWQKSGQHIATRLGTQQATLSTATLNSLGQYTGVTLAYSNKDIRRHVGDADDKSRSLLQNTAQDYKNIRGTGPAGGLAELRINGQPAARIQIGLDGRYEFLNLDLTRFAIDYTNVEIALYEYPLATQPMSVERIRLGRRRSNVATDELLLQTGMGTSGNWFNDQWRDQSHSSEWVASVYAEYGLSNQLAVRSSIDHAQHDVWLIGANYVASRYSNIDVSYAQSPTQQVWQADWQYQNKNLFGNYHFLQRSLVDSESWVSGKDQDNPSNSQQTHHVSLTYQPTQYSSFNLNHYYDNFRQGARRDYTTLSSTLNWRNDWQLGANYDSRGDRYGYRALWQRHDQPNSFGWQGGQQYDQWSWQHRYSPTLSFGASIAKWRYTDSLLHQAFINYLPMPNQQWTATFSQYQGDIGWRTQWQYYKNNGINLSVGYGHHYFDGILALGQNGTGRDDPNNAWQYPNTVAATVPKTPKIWTEDDYFFVQLSMNVWRPPTHQIQSLGGWVLGYYPRQKNGSIIVDIKHPPSPAINAQDLRFWLDDDIVVAKLIGNSAANSQYLIENIPAGVYQLKVDTKNLPIEYSARQLPAPYVEVNHTAPTLVPLTLIKTFAVAGSLADHKPNIQVQAWQHGQVVDSTKTDASGYFQLVTLPSGTYQLQAAGYEPQWVRIDQDFVFNVRLLPQELPKN